MSLIAGRGCRWPPRRDSVSPCAPLSGGRDTHDGHENSPILVFFSNLLGGFRPPPLRPLLPSPPGEDELPSAGVAADPCHLVAHERRTLFPWSAGQHHIISSDLSSELQSAKGPTG